MKFAEPELQGRLDSLGPKKGVDVIEGEKTLKMIKSRWQQSIEKLGFRKTK
jgi:hypothetical protein